ncbi:MAG: glycosyltransferase family 4 protein [Desulfurococcaceae archaeon]|nr:glycosyltransferase family 4 protein [Desulfurococcaceae archaeon]
MKILHIVQDLDFGGVTIVIANLVKAFCKLGVENIVITPQIRKELTGLLRSYSSRIFVLGGNINPFNSIDYILTRKGRIVEIISREKPDAIIVQPGWLSLVYRFIPNDVPTLVVVHGTYLNEIRYMWFHPIKGIERIRYITGILASQAIELLQLKLASARQNILIIAVSKNTRKELVNMGMQDNKIVSILNGVDKDVFKPMNKDYAKTLVEEIFRIRLKDKILLHVNPGPIKGTYILIKAVAMLKRILGDNFTLLIVGRLRPKTYREYVEDMIRGLKLEENIKMLGYVEHRLLPLFYNAADITVVPSYSEGAPLVIPESLACGTPVIATNVGGNPEYLNMVGLADYIVEVRQYDFSSILALRLLKALTSNRELGRNVVHERIPSWSDISHRYLHLLKNLDNLS